MSGVFDRVRHLARPIVYCALLASGLPLATGAGARDQIDRYGIDGWVVAIRHDGFTGEIRCNLRSATGDMLYQPGAIGFRIGSRRDTLGAWYRLDNGPARRWQDRYPALIASGAVIDGSGLDSPTDGVVWLPEGDVVGIANVAIKVGDRGRARSFSLRGYAKLAAAARRLGCWRY